MPTDIAAPFSIKTDITLTNANQAYQINPPSRASTLTVYFNTTAGFIGSSGTEGVALASSSKHPVEADREFVVKVNGSPIFLESATGGTVVNVIAEQ